MANFFGSSYWPPDARDLGVGEVSYLDLLILYELWAGNVLSVRKPFLECVEEVSHFRCRLLLWVPASIFGNHVGWEGSGHGSTFVGRPHVFCSMSCCLCLAIRYTLETLCSRRHLGWPSQFVRHLNPIHDVDQGISKVMVTSGCTRMSHCSLRDAFTDCQAQVEH